MNFPNFSVIFNRSEVEMFLRFNGIAGEFNEKKGAWKREKNAIIHSESWFKTPSAVNAAGMRKNKKTGKRNGKITLFDSANV